MQPLREVAIMADISLDGENAGAVPLTFEDAFEVYIYIYILYSLFSVNTSLCTCNVIVYQCINTNSLLGHPCIIQYVLAHTDCDLLMSVLL
jgi:hypothetical protein